MLLAIELVLSYAIHDMSVLFKLKDHLIEVQLYWNRTFAAVMIVILLTSVLLFRISHLQIKQHEVYSKLSSNNRLSMVYVSPNRGLIYDRKGNLLAENIPSFNLEIIPNQIKDMEKLILELNEFIKISEQDILNFNKQRRFKSRYESIPIRTKLTEEEVAKFSVVKYKFPGVDVAARLSRYYPYSKEFAHVLGYIAPISDFDLENIDINEYRGTYQIGKLGLEHQYENILHGKLGMSQVETDARGRTIRVLNKNPTTPGQTLKLSIDANLQMVAYQELLGKKGAVVALDPNNGEILTLISSPSFDVNLFVQGIDNKSYKSLESDKQNPMFNRALQGLYSPGSTIKPIIALQALKSGIITPNTKFNDLGYYKISEEGRLFRCWRRYGHGRITLERALAESCTTYFFMLADKLGIDNIYNAMHSFGLGTVTGIDLSGEAAGVAPSAEWKLNTKHKSWFHGETLNVGIGQGYTLVTPLQMAKVAMLLANKGILYTPHILQKQHNESYKIAWGASPKHWHVINQALQKSASSYRGTAHKIYNSSGPKIAGKTGTVQLFGIKQNETYNAEQVLPSLRDHSWFIAYAPADAPKIAIAVIVENEKGASVIAGKIINSYLQELG